jgi:(p)ppGpp synthase/HD superfamily hydrolase
MFMEAKEESRALTLTTCFIQAVDYARQIHVGTRKGTQTPYMAHLLGVASLVMGETGHVPFAVTEDMVIASLLHDAVCPDCKILKSSLGKMSPKS